MVCDTRVDKKRRSATPVCWARPAPGTTRGPSDTGTRPYQSNYPIILILQIGDTETYKGPLMAQGHPAGQL